MKRVLRGLVALVCAAAVLTVGHSPAGALAAGAMEGGGWMGSASGPGLATTAVSGSVSGTLVTTAFGTCTFTADPFNGQESLIQGQGVGTLCNGFCQFAYSRVDVELAINGICGGSVTFTIGGTMEPTSVLPTTSFLFEAVGVSSPPGAAAIEGSLAFTPGGALGVDAGTISGSSTSVTFSGGMIGFLNGVVGSCSFWFSGTGNEGWVTGSSSMAGTCNGPGVSDSCSMSWSHVGIETAMSGVCSGSLGFSFSSVGELVMTGNSFTYAGGFLVT